MAKTDASSERDADAGRKEGLNNFVGMYLRKTQSRFYPQRDQLLSVLLRRKKSDQYADQLRRLQVAKDTQTYREDEGSPSNRMSNAQVNQQGMDESPAEGGEGYVGSDTGPSLGLNIIQGKKGSVTSRPIWSTQSSGADQDMGAPETSFGGQDSTDEKASYKKIQTDEGLPQTYRNSAGAGDASPSEADEPDTNGLKPQNVDYNTQKIGSEMPQTGFTKDEGGGAPLFKR
jgi:hypothetical protein